MKTRIILATIFSTVCTLSYGQSTVGGVSSQGIDMNTRAGGMVSEIPMEAPKTVGNSYLYDQWFRGNIILKNGQVIEGYPMKYDLNNNYFEIKTDKSVKALSGLRVEKFSLSNNIADEHYVNSSEFASDGNILKGFFKQIYGDEDQFQLFEYSYAEVIQGNYNAALDIGERDSKIIKKSEFYLAKDESKYLVESSRKKFSRKFPNQSKIFSFIKSNKLNLKIEEDLKQLVDFLNAN